jgi:hypothetical protein
MVKKILFSFSLSFMTVCQCFAQSKKEQIEQLNHIIDSISNVANTRSNRIDSLKNVEVKLKEKLEQNMQLLVSQNNAITELELTIKKLELETINQKNDFALKINQLRDSLVQMLTQNTNSDMFFLTDFAEGYIGLSDPNFCFDFQLKESNDEKITGSFKSFWPKGWSENYGNGSKKIEYASGEYKNGLKNGYWKYTLCNGEKQYEGNYLNGLRHGKWTNYDLCNSSFNYSNLAMIYTISDYYQLELLGRISKEEVIFEKGIPNEFFYYRDDENNVVLKINYRTGRIYYDNDQPLTNQSTIFKYPSFTGKEKKELLVYHKNGTVAYKMIDSGNQKSEFFYGLNGSLVSKCIYLNGIGNCESYDENGTLIDNYENNFGSGKYGGECPCQ